MGVDPRCEWRGVTYLLRLRADGPQVSCSALRLLSCSRVRERVNGQTERSVCPWLSVGIRRVTWTNEGRGSEAFWGGGGEGDIFGSSTGQYQHDRVKLTALLQSCGGIGGNCDGQVTEPVQQGPGTIRGQGTIRDQGPALVRGLSGVRGPAAVRGPIGVRGPEAGPLYPQPRADGGEWGVGGEWSVWSGWRVECGEWVESGVWRVGGEWRVGSGWRVECGEWVESGVWGVGGEWSVGSGWRVECGEWVESGVWGVGVECSVGSGWRVECGEWVESGVWGVGGEWNVGSG